MTIPKGTRIICPHCGLRVCWLMKDLEWNTRGSPTDPILSDGKDGVAPQCCHCQAAWLDFGKFLIHTEDGWRSFGPMDSREQVVRCECGAEAAHDTHANWCPMKGRAA